MMKNHGKTVMNYQEYEATVVAICLHKPTYLNRVNEKILFSDPYNKILAIARKVHYDGFNHAISKDMLYQLVKNKGLEVNPKILDELYQVVDECEIQGEIGTDRKFTASYYFVEDAFKATTKALAAGKARELFLAGKNDEAMSLLKSIKYETRAKLEDTDILMERYLEQKFGIKSGIKSLDNKLGGIRLGSLACLSGDTGAMKTRFSLWWILQILEENPDLTALYFEKEMIETDVAGLIASRIMGINTAKITKMVMTEGENAAKRVYAEAKERMQGTPFESAWRRLRIVPAVNFYNANDVYKYVESENAQLWALDFLTMIGNSKDGKFDDVSHQVEILKDVALSTVSFGIILNQLNKNTITKRKDKIPQVDDLEYGTKMKQEASYIWALFNPGMYWDNNPPNVLQPMKDNDYYFIAQKARNGSIKDMNCYFQYDKTFTQYHEVFGNESDRMSAWLGGYTTKYTGYIRE